MIRLGVYMQRGWLIIFEGGEGSGKDAQIGSLIEHYKSKYAPEMFVVTHEPGGGNPNYRAEILALDKADPHLAEREFELFEADRAVHYRDTIFPALRTGKIVFCNRSGLSTLAYQGYGRGMDLALIRAANDKATSGCSADLTVILDLDPRIGIVRKFQNQPERLNRFETEEGYDFHDRVRAGYLAEARKEPEKFFVIHASAPKELITREIIAELNKRFGL